LLTLNDVDTKSVLLFALVWLSLLELEMRGVFHIADFALNMGVLLTGFRFLNLETISLGCLFCLGSAL
jgi:hypothetical protein